LPPMAGDSKLICISDDQVVLDLDNLTTAGHIPCNSYLVNVVVKLNQSKKMPRNGDPKGEGIGARIILLGMLYRNCYRPIILRHCVVTTFWMRCNVG
jgi:hypothetical protein